MIDPRPVADLRLVFAVYDEPKLSCPTFTVDVSELGVGRPGMAHWLPLWVGVVLILADHGNFTVF
jgi:hypothetical protein